MYANVCPVNRNLPVHNFVNPNLQCAALKPFPLANGATRNQNHLCFGYQFVVLDVLMVLQTNLLFGCLTYSFIYSLDTVKAKIIASLSDSTLAYPAMPPHFVESFSTLGFSAVPAKWGYWTQRLNCVKGANFHRSVVIVGNDMIGTSNSWGSNFVVRGPSLMATQSWYVDEGCPILHTH